MMVKVLLIDAFGTKLDNLVFDINTIDSLRKTIDDLLTKHQIESGDFIVENCDTTYHIEHSKYIDRNSEENIDTIRDILIKKIAEHSEQQSHSITSSFSPDSSVGY